MSRSALLRRLAEEERDRATVLRLEADRLDRRAAELDLHANEGAPADADATRATKLLLSPTDAGRMLGQSRQKIVEMCQRGELRHGRTTSGYYQIPRQAIRDYVDQLNATP